MSNYSKIQEALQMPLSRDLTYEDIEEYNIKPMNI